MHQDVVVVVVVVAEGSGPGGVHQEDSHLELTSISRWEDEVRRKSKEDYEEEKKEEERRGERHRLNNKRKNIKMVNIIILEQLVDSTNTTGDEGRATGFGDEDGSRRRGGEARKVGKAPPRGAAQVFEASLQLINCK